MYSVEAFFSTKIAHYDDNGLDHLNLEYALNNASSTVSSMAQTVTQAIAQTMAQKWRMAPLRHRLRHASVSCFVESEAGARRGEHWPVLGGFGRAVGDAYGLWAEIGEKSGASAHI